MARSWLLIYYVVTTFSSTFGELTPYSLQSAVDALHRREAQLALRDNYDPSKYSSSLDDSAFWNGEQRDDSFPPYRGSRQQLNKLLANYLAREEDEQEQEARENSIYGPSDYDDDDYSIDEKKRSMFREREEIPIQSVFREREMDMNPNLAQDFLREIDRQRNLEHEEKYRETLKHLWDKYQQQENEIEEELFDDEKKRYDPGMSMGPGRVMAKKEYPSYPVAFRAKRFPVSKRSPKPLEHHITEDREKVDKDLAAIFGETADDKKKRSSDERVLKKREESTTEPHDDHKHEHDDHDHDEHDDEHEDDHEFGGDDEEDFDDSEEDDKKKKKRAVTHKRKRSSNLEIIDEDQIIPSDLAILKKKKSSFQWSKYFGMDRRKKSYRVFDMDHTKKKKKSSEHPLSNFRSHESPELEHDGNMLNDGKLSKMDEKLKTIEDLIIDETVKYTGAHEGISNPDEIRKLKDHVVSRLATAYSLEKMRRALEKLKTSVVGQHHLVKNEVEKNGPEPVEEDENDKKKRVAMKKEKVDFDNNNHEIESATQKVLPESPENGIEDEEEKKKKKKKNELPAGNDVNEFEDELGAGHFVEPLSEGYMGGNSLLGSPNQCPILDTIEKRCRGVDLLSGDIYQGLLPICSIHQLCYICGPTQTECDFQYLSEADSICGHNTECQAAARSALMILRGVANPQLGPRECSKNACLYHAMREIGL